MDHLEGGFVIHKAPAILSGFHRHTLDLDGRPISDFDLAATNRIQATPWTINRRVAEVARRLLVEDVPSPLVPGSELVAVPGRMPDDLWETMDDAARKKHRGTIARAHEENASRKGRRASFLDALDTATEMEAHPAFWFVWTHDFRLRRYPVACGGLSPQGSDLSKNLMMFSRGKPLGDAGFYWLCIRAANAAGHDKLPHDDRFAWAEDNLATMRRIAADPVRHRELWEAVESPWEYLATVFELATATESGRPAEFISHLPVPQDGSCNGLQHLSAMGLDPIGALATNLCAVPERHDVYLAVAEHARQRVETDAAKGLPTAMVWLGKVDRDAVKRAVLATPYGVTDEGIRRQLVEDGKVPFSETISQKDASAYFRDVLVDALSGTVVAAKSIMAWLQTSAFRLAQAGMPMVWKTPTGSTIRQAYVSSTQRQIWTLVGRLAMLSPVKGGTLDAKKQSLGSSPQVVHSFDASHLASTVNTLGARGISDFAMIHDSFGVHACDTPMMNAVLRRAFVTQYAPNRLVELAEGFRSFAPHVDIPEPPARGTFDLAANVPSAPFFFA